MKTTITVGIDNIPSEGLKQEWGLSLFIGYGDKKILLDTGASDLFLRNYEKMGIDIADVDYGVLSHAHCDHANGIPAFFEHNSKAKFYVSEDTAPDCYGKISFIKFYCGIPKTMMDDHADRIVKVSDVYELCEGAYIVPHKKGGYPEIGMKGHMLRKTKSGYVPDDLSHEQSLVLDTEKGLVILTDPDHAGEQIRRMLTERFPEAVQAYIA
ncbi:MAG: MBL fold metallo-hydrolase, partial [Oscillospiraceae bacterium]|nr:MBL fold metallo-hydrolase [Oscillospiraceae bacterium]